MKYDPEMLKEIVVLQQLIRINEFKEREKWHMEKLRSYHEER